MNVRWSEEERGMLAEMWLCGLSSVDIAQVIGRTRHAIMGRINKSGLMGRQGHGITTPSDAGTARKGVEACLAGLAGETPTRDLVDVCRVALAMVADGRGSGRLHVVAGLGEARTDQIADALHDSRTWALRAAAPVRWWTGGHGAMRADLAKVATTLKQREEAHAA